MKRTAAPLVAILVSGCSTTAIDYAQWDRNSQTPIPSTALRFRLQETTISISQQIPSSSNGQGNQAQNAAGKAAPVNQPQIKSAPNCSGNSGQVASTDWWQCFAQVSAQSAPTASDLTDPEAPVYIANPHKAFLNLSTTKISGVAITGQDGLYSVVTVNYTNNTAAVITAAGTGAVAGFGIAGPYGAAAGFVIGAITAPAHGVAAGPLFPGAPGAAPAPPEPIMAYICPGEPVDLTAVQTSLATKSPIITYPVAIANSSIGGLAPNSELKLVNKPGPVVAGTPNACWHALPNRVSNEPTAIGQIGGTDAPRQLQPGDGWLYRIVAKDDDLTKPPLPADKPVGEYFGASFGSNPHSDFPYSSCRKAVLEITWWSELENAIRNNPAMPSPRVLHYDVTIADPRFVSIADLTKGGAVNFRPDCGATSQATADLSTSAILNASVTEGEGIFKAEQSWAGAKTGTATKTEAKK